MSLLNPSKNDFSGIRNKMRYRFKTIACCLSIPVVGLVAAWYFFQPADSSPGDPKIVAKLYAASHCKSDTAASDKTLYLARNAGLKTGFLNAFGIEPRFVSQIAGGAPEHLFSELSFLGGYSEIIWVDQWTNFPIKLPASQSPRAIVVPRNAAIKAMLESIHASGGCLIKAGPHRYLVAKISEREKYEAAIRSAGWLDGINPPWDKDSD